MALTGRDLQLFEELYKQLPEKVSMVVEYNVFPHNWWKVKVVGYTDSLNYIMYDALGANFGEVLMGVLDYLSRNKGMTDSAGGVGNDV